MQFGVFDHLDRNDLPLREYYEGRLKLAEAYDHAGFYAYHVAEHHSTPLGMAPSPSVFLSAVAQRTHRLRFGPLVYALPLYHPMRLIEEICMLDQMSGGRLDIGFGRGASQIESAMYGNDPAKAELMYVEGLELIMRGLTQKSLNFHGQFYSFDDVPMELEPLQKPHPPVWYGVHSPVSAERAARQGLNIVSLDPADKTRTFTDRFRQVWCESENRQTREPMVGLGRFIVVAAKDEEALDIARRAYPRWHRSFNYLFNLRGGKGPVHQRPADVETLIKIGQGIAGSPNTVSEFLKAQMTESGANYLVGQFAFGDLSLSEILSSLELFTRHVMPELRGID
ncbi:MAG TPA: LLM class flavin-dependent oxidoreductase [Candidatus Binatia bacterium]|jgi:alkanesulfonate monooxygenase SsuD/methylene tetrahydromethanopterin reductase-like flavin-dependent oxidoreductase (luciferase family)